MSRYLRHLMLGTAVAMIAGCSTVNWSYTPGSGWSWGIGEKEKKQDTVIDQAWRSGAGINNPNPERIREGKPPLNFDGSVYKP